MNSFMERKAYFSNDRKYRYELWRIWDPKKPYIVFIGLNPSTADENVDDNTVRFCCGLAMRWNYGAFCMLNLFAYRATNPKDMKAQADPVSTYNDISIMAVCKDADVIVCAWGKDGGFQGRADAVLKMLTLHATKLKCLGKLKNGEPHHPLYMDATTRLQPYP